MRTVLFVLVSLLVVSACFALESDPSNKVGYVKVNTLAGEVGNEFFMPFGLPFIFWYVPTGNVPVYGDTTYNLAYIIGTQMPCGVFGETDFIWQQDQGYTAWRVCEGGNNWEGDLVVESFDGVNPGYMAPSYAYWWVNAHGADLSFVLAGEADITAVHIPSIFLWSPWADGEYAYYGYSWRDPRFVPRDQLNLLAQGFTGGEWDYLSDQVWEQAFTGRIFWYDNVNNIWAYSEEDGGLMGIAPGEAYWLVNSHYAHDWSYTYDASGTELRTPTAPVSEKMAKTTIRSTQKAPKDTKSNTLKGNRFFPTK